MIKILFVDDEKLLVSVFQSLCRKFDFDGTVKTDSREALKVFKENPHKFDVVITDFCMPHMNGLVFTKEIKAIKPDIPVILSTGFIDKISPEEISSSGFATVLTKPYRIIDMVSTIKEIVANISFDEIGGTLS